MISTLKKIYFSFEDLWRNPETNDVKKMIILGEEKKLEKLLNRNSTNKLNIKLRKNNKENNIENNSSLTILDDDLVENKEKNTQKYSFDSSIPEYI